jgi:hypothetical protein
MLDILEPQLLEKLVVTEIEFKKLPVVDDAI